MPTRLNKFIAQHTDYSRRNADELIARGRVEINGLTVQPGQLVNDGDTVTLDERVIETAATSELKTVIMNKPVGYVCSRDGQGSPTVYELLPVKLQHLNSVGRLDKDSSGLLVLTNDGQLANELTHPRYQKTKVYEVEIDRPLAPLHQQMISDIGVTLEDGVSKLMIEKQNGSAQHLVVSMHEGRNRQIRRTFYVLGYTVTKLHRTTFGSYQLGPLGPGQLSNA